MAGYEYNPLLKLNLQKKEDSATPGDIDRLEGEIETLRGDMSDKVPKFYRSIEELEVGEIGQFQGEVGGDFVPGYFYKRRSAVVVTTTEPQYTWSASNYLDITDPATGELVKRQYERDISPDGYITFTPEQVISAYCSANVKCYLFSPDFLIADNLQLVTVNGNNYLLLPYAQIDNGGTDCYFDFDNPIQYLGNNTVKYLDNEPYVLSRAGYNLHCWVSADTTDTNMLYVWLGHKPYFPLIISSDFTKVGFDGVTPFPTGFVYHTAIGGTQQITSQTTTLQSQSPFIRVDAQPALDPSDFATATQGAKADTALQTIESGTSSDYVAVTVTPKQANEQRLGVTLKIQDINTASENAKGLLEAWNARNYIDTQVYKVSLNFFFYGVQWDENDPSPDCTRIGNMGLHAELPVQNAIIGGLLADDLTFTPFTDQSDWSGETVDGSAGQVMVQIPQYYFKSEVHGTLHKKLISQYPLAGFTKIPVMYISAEKATVDRTDPNTPKLCSVVNTTAAFRGGNNTADWDGTYRSLLGFPACNLSLTQFRQYARNRAAGTAWNCAAYHAQRSLYWLFVTEYATLNSQKPYNAAKDVNGYMQGGLGPGVSNWNNDAWNAYNGYNPLIPCGYMLTFGNKSAVKNYSVKDGNNNVLVTFEVNSYHGIQSPFGDIWDWTDGILINVQSDEDGGVSTCYVTDEPAKFSSSDFSQYNELGNTPRADSWIKSIFDGEQGDIICKTQGGSSTAYYCDYCWGGNLPASGVSLRGVLFGGRAFGGARCGFLFANSHNVPGDVHPAIGSRLCAFPSP